MPSLALVSLAGFIATTYALQRTCGSTPSDRQVHTFEIDFKTRLNLYRNGSANAAISVQASPILPVSDPLEPEPVELT